MTLCDRLEQYFRARPGVWIDGRTLATIAGAYAWRSRVADLRKRGLTVENRQRHWYDLVRDRKWTQSEYRYVPADLLALAEDR